MNKMKEIWVIGITALLVCGAGIGMVGGNTEDTDIGADGLEFTADGLRDLLRTYNVTEDRITVSGIDIEYTMDELLDLYCKYSITENDIKFAMGELPNPLEGTILDGKHRVIATETGEPPERLPPEWQEGDYILITIEERGAIGKGARERYIEKYGVDPGNPKIDVANSIPFPVEEVKRLLKSGEISIEYLADAEPLMTPGTLGGPSNGPHAIGGKIYVHIFVATDDAHKPTEPDIEDDTEDALDRFETEFGVDMIPIWIDDFWDASDVAEPTNSTQVLRDLAEDTSWVIDENHPDDIVIGWAHDLDHNGMAYRDYFYAVCSDTRDGIGDWPHDSIVQHETSHLFDAPEGGWLCYPPECIMNYCWALYGTEIWCDSCRETVMLNIRGICGDVNGDGKVTMSDVRKVFNRYLDPNYPLDSPWAADVNCDGKVTMSDVRKVFNRYLDSGYELNCCEV